MQKKITTTGTSRALVLSKDMLAHLRIQEEDEMIEVLYLSDGTLALAKPMAADQYFRREETTKLYDNAPCDHTLRQARSAARKKLVSGIRRKNRGEVETGEALSLSDLQSGHPR